MKLDVFTLGEAMLRLSVPVGSPLERSGTLAAHAGGAEANTAAALAGLGRKVSWFSRLPDNVLGRRVEWELRSFGVDLSCVLWAKDSRLGLYFVEHRGFPLASSVTYDRMSSAASELTSEVVPWDIAATARLIHISGITPALSSGCEALTLDLASFAKERAIPLTFDINFRSKLWSEWTAAEFATRIAPMVDVLILTNEDARDLFGVTGTPEEVVNGINNMLRPRSTVLTLGATGAAWVSRDASGLVDGLKAVEVDKFGAGDAFAAGVIDGLLDGDLETGINRGVVLGALAVGSHGDLLQVRRNDLGRFEGGRTVDR